ncbi:hypothetical protein Hanom_Chr16g01426281 [Helianthus anomalus]
MGYNVENPIRPISKSDFLKLWQYLVTQLGVCYSKKTINYHEISYKLMQPVHAIVQEVSYNYSHYQMKDHTSNLWSSRPFLVYPRFMMRVITRQLGFRGIPAWYPKAKVVLQQNIRNTLLVPPSNNTGLVTHLWLFVELIFGED